MRRKKIKVETHPRIKRPFVGPRTLEDVIGIAVDIAFGKYNKSLQKAIITKEDLRAHMTERISDILQKFDPSKSSDGTINGLLVDATKKQALNLIAQDQRRRNRERIATTSTKNLKGPARIAMNHEIELAIRSALESRLTHGEIIVMEKYLFEHGGKHGSAVKIAENLGTTEGAVRKMISKARKKLKDDPVLRELMGFSE